MSGMIAGGSGHGGSSKGEVGSAAGLGSRLTPWLVEVAPRVGLAGFTVATVTIDRMAFQVINTSAGRLPTLILQDRLEIYRKTVTKQTALMLLQFTGTRELKFAIDNAISAPAFSTMVACGLTGVPCSSLQYNWTIQDTYKHFKTPSPPTDGLLGFLRQKVAPGIVWAFARASCGTGGGLYFGPKAAAHIDRGLRASGIESTPAFSKVLGSLTTGAVFSLATQWFHNVALVAGRMAALGETKQAPHYTTVALRSAWHEMGASLVYRNFPQRMVIQAVTVCILNVCNIFHRPDISGWE